MNTIYRIVWNAASRRWVVASEFAKGRKKASAAKLVVALAAAMTASVAAPAFALSSAGTASLVVNDMDFGTNDAGNCNAITGDGTATNGVAYVNCNSTAYLKDVYNNVNQTSSVVIADKNLSVGGYQFINGKDSNNNALTIQNGGNVLMSGGKISGMAAGNLSATSTDAVNGSQLYATNQNVTNVTSAVNTITNGGGIKYFRVNSTGNDASASVSPNGIAIGSGANAGTAPMGIDQSNAIAIGTNSATVGTNSISIGNNATSSTAGGFYANTTSMVAIGANSSVTYGHSMAIGIGAQATPASNGTSGMGYALAVGENAAVTQVHGSAFGSLSSVSGTDATAIGYSSAASATSASALGVSSKASGQWSIALGSSSAASAAWTVALGSSAQAQGTGDIALGASSIANNGGGNNYATAVGTNANASAANASALGAGAKVTAANSVALGANTLADRANAVSVGTSSAQRQVMNMAAGTADTDAVNVAQLKSVSQSTANAIGGGAAVNADGTLKAPSITVGGKAYGDVTSAIQATATAVGNIDALNWNATTGAYSAKHGGSVQKITDVKNGNVAAGSSDAVTGDQLYTTNQQVAQNTSSIANNTASISNLDTRVTNNETSISTLNTNVSNLDNRVTNVEGSVSNISNQINNGSIGLVQQDAALGVVTVAKSSGGTVVDVTGTAGARKVTGVAEGDVSAASKDAINGSQLFATNQQVAQNTADIASNTSSINSLDSRVTNNENNISNLDNRVTNVEGSVSNISNQISNGSIGLVQQDAASGVVTVAKSSGGTVVDMTGTAGARKVTGVAEGDVSVSSKDAVNGSQLFATNQQVAQNTSDIANNTSSINSLDSRVTNNESSISTINTNVSKLDGRMTVVEGDVANISNQINNGSIGLVQQDAAGVVTVAKSSGGTVVDVAGTAGTRKVTGVAEGDVSAASKDAVNGSQLFATNQQVAQNTADIASNTSSINSLDTRVTNNESSISTINTNVSKLDGRVTVVEGDVANISNQINNGSIGLVQQDAASGVVTVAKSSGGTVVDVAGTAGNRKVTGVAEGDVSVSSKDAVNGSQLFATNQQWRRTPATSAR